MKNIFLSLGAIMMLFLSSCKTDSDTNGTASLKVNLTDAPAKYDKVEIDVQKLELGTGADGWTVLNLAKAGIYNLLD